MEINTGTNKILIALSAGLMILIVIYLIFVWRTTPTINNGTALTPTMSESIEPTALPPLQITLAIPKSIEQVPTIPYSKGGGIDTNNVIVKESKENIKKIVSALPYKKIIKTSNGLNVEVLIPPANLQQNPWTFTASVYGIDYQVEKNTPEYILMRTAFREGAADILSFVRKQGVDPEKIIFQWGDRVFVEERAQEWLQ